MESKKEPSRTGMDNGRKGSINAVRQQNEIIEELKNIKDNDLRICIFGCGQVGRGAGFDIVEFLGFKVSYYCDNNSEMWGESVRNEVKCISPKELAVTNKVACFVMVGRKYNEEIMEQLKAQGLEMIISYIELCTLDIVINSFLRRCSEENSKLDSKNDIIWTESRVSLKTVKNKDNKKYVVYTCITGDYDQVVEPQYYSEECDYYLISDKKPTKLNIFQWINIDEVIPKSVKDNRIRNRFCKINVSQIFSEYKYSIYIDGNILVMKDIRQCVKKIGKSGIAVHLLPYSECLYDHALACVISKADNRNLIFQQMDKYQREGMPRKYGMFECTILVRDNENPICKKVMLDWWNEVFNQSCRDQLSFTYCLWKNGLVKSDVGILGEDHRKSEYFKMVSWHHYVNGRWS